MDLIRLQSNLSKLDVVDLAYTILDDMSDFIADLNRKRLAEEGKNSDGVDLFPYADLTIELKQKYGKGIGRITDHTTLFDTGALHKSIFASVISDELIVDATDPKTDELEDKYGEFLGLTAKEIELVHNEFIKRFIPALENAILR